MRAFREKWIAGRKWRVLAEELGRIGRCLNNLVGMGLDITPNARGGFNFEAREGFSRGGGVHAVPAIITGGGAGAYSINLHANGLNQPSTGTGTLEVPGLIIDEVLPNGTAVVAVLSAVVTDEPEPEEPAE